MSRERSTASPTVKRIRAGESAISTVCSASRSSISLRTSLTVLRGTITGGMPSAPAGSPVSTRARRWPSVATERRQLPAPSSIACRKMPLR